MTNIKAIIDKYNLERINFLLEKDDWKKFQKNNVTIAYDSKHNSNCEKQLFF